MIAYPGKMKESLTARATKQKAHGNSNTKRYRNKNKSVFALETDFMAKQQSMYRAEMRYGTEITVKCYHRDWCLQCASNSQRYADSILLSKYSFSYQCMLSERTETKNISNGAQLHRQFLVGRLKCCMNNISFALFFEWVPLKNMCSTNVRTTHRDFRLLAINSSSMHKLFIALSQCAYAFALAFDDAKL